MTLPAHSAGAMHAVSVERPQQHCHPIVLVHGYWHGSWCFAPVVESLAARGRCAVAVDMAGHGIYARRPRSLYTNPFSMQAFATERSPVADVDLDAAAHLLKAQLTRIGGGAALTVLAHSMAGTVLTRVAQDAPHLVARAVYLNAAMPASGTSALAYSQIPENDGELAVPCLVGDPGEIGAMRLHVGSGDQDYRRKVRAAFYADVDEATADAAIALLSPDAPLGIAAGTTRLTVDGWGSVPRSYLTCSQDMAIRPALQRKFIVAADDAFPDNPTQVVQLDASHSPFLSVPEALAEVIATW